MSELPEAFKQRMKLELGDEYDAFIASYSAPASRGLRVNTLKISVADFLNISPFELIPSGIIDEGFVLAQSAISPGSHPYHAAGLYYMQEPSAMSAIDAMQICPGMRVLDMCAAPGGKSGGIAARLNGTGLLISNELVASRAKVLKSNLERLGVTNAAVTSAHPDSIRNAFPEYFDVVAVDAPCSGEGMFRKDHTAIDEWSVEHVRSCALRQSAILESACTCVKGGGALVYSTCTFSHEENEDVVNAFLASHPDFELESMRRLYPHTCSGEGHFCARLVRTIGGFKSQSPLSLPVCRDAEYNDFITDTFAEPPRGIPVALKDRRVQILPECGFPCGLSTLHVLNCGVYAGDIARGRFIPSHALFMAADLMRAKRTVDLEPDSQELISYLHGDTISCETAIRGYTAVQVSGQSLGFAKAVSGVLKNHLPKGLRILQCNLV